MLSRMRLALIFLPLALLTTSLSALTSETVRDGEVSITLVTPAASAAPGQQVWVGVRFQMEGKWHTYWQNPGNTGLATQVNWTTPAGVEVGELNWPYPEVYRNAHLVDFVYFGEAALYAPVTVPADWPVGQPLALSAEVDWLMCEEICIPGKGEVSLSIPVADQPAPDPEETAAFSETRAKWPAPLDSLAASYRADSQAIQLTLSGLETPSQDLSGMFFFPLGPSIEPSGAQEWQASGDTLTVALAQSEYATELPETVRGVLYAPDGWPQLEGRKAILVDAQRSSGELSTAGGESAGGSGGTGGLVGLLALAFAGGIILNLMPCVFPVLGIKIMGFVEQAGKDKGKIVGHGLLFALGVLVSFWILAGALLALRAGGAELGWGFQLQSAPFVFGMAAFLLLFALNLSGVFEIGLGLMTLGSKADSGKGAGGSFLSGVLATVVATPCSAPLLAPALAGALTLPPFQSLLTFTFIALGLSTPYLLLSLFPALLKKLPPPGAWMETLKQFMAFPLYATVGWLVYVLAGQLNGENLLNALLALTLLALAAWVYGRYGAPHLKKKTRRTGIITAALLLVAAIAYGYPKKEVVQWIPWSAETISSLREDDRIVYVDFTARWCATCQVNKKVVFSSQEVLRTIDELDVALVKADWTNENPAITRRLAELGKAAVPVNLVYRPGAESQEILPETLTPGIVLKALRGERE